MKNQHTQNHASNRLLLATSLVAIIELTGCQDKGPAEKAGQKIDQATADTAQKLEAAKQSMDLKVVRAENAVDKSVEASKQSIALQGEKVEQSVAKAENEIVKAQETVINKTESAGEYLDDSAITLKVKTAILSDTLLNTSQIEVSTVNGEVTLNGLVDSEPAIARAEDLVKNQKNVKAVKSNLIVRINAAGKP